jgi:hypothetical protein
MWMTNYVREVKRQLRDRYGFQPVRVEGDELIFAEGQIPEGEYPLEIDGKIDHVLVVNGRFQFCRFEMEVATDG